MIFLFNVQYWLSGGFDDFICSSCFSFVVQYWLSGCFDDFICSSCFVL